MSLPGVRTPDFFEVRPDKDEVAEWFAKHPRRRPPYRSKCRRCGKRIWHSGVAVAAHRRACKANQ